MEPRNQSGVTCHTLDSAAGALRGSTTALKHTSSHDGHPCHAHAGHRRHGDGAGGGKHLQAVAKLPHHQPQAGHDGKCHREVELL